MRQSRHNHPRDTGQGQITDTVSIRERPASVEDRAVPGHWEGGLIFGTHNSQIAMLVERHTRYVMLAKVSSKETETVINALIKQDRQLPSELCKSLTLGSGQKDGRKVYGGCFTCFSVLRVKAREWVIIRVQLWKYHGLCYAMLPVKMLP
jgi:hypothetical protein